MCVKTCAIIKIHLYLYLYLYVYFDFVFVFVSVFVHSLLHFVFVFRILYLCLCLVFASVFCISFLYFVFYFVFCIYQQRMEGPTEAGPQGPRRGAMESASGNGGMGAVYLREHIGRMRR